jgi:hypothetical protein
MTAVKDEDCDLLLYSAKLDGILLWIFSVEHDRLYIIYGQRPSECYSCALF